MDIFVTSIPEILGNGTVFRVLTVIGTRLIFQPIDQVLDVFGYSWLVNNHNFSSCLMQIASSNPPLLMGLGLRSVASFLQLCRKGFHGLEKWLRLFLIEVGDISIQLGDDIILSSIV